MASRRLQLGPPDAGTVTPGAGGAQSQAHLVAGCHMRRWARAESEEGKRVTDLQQTKGILEASARRH